MPLLSLSSYLLLLLFSLGGLFLSPLTLAKELVHAPSSPVINDQALQKSLLYSLSSQAQGSSRVSAKTLFLPFQSHASIPLPRSLKITPSPLRSKPSKPSFSYSQAIKSIVILSSVFWDPQEERWHLGAITSGWILSPTLIVTNYHPFHQASDSAYGVMTSDQKFTPILECVAGCKYADIAVFRVAQNDSFTHRALSLASQVTIGETAHVISHPHNRFFTYTRGATSRLFELPLSKPLPSQQSKRSSMTQWLAITADFAQGSSGAPVLNDEGEVIGMVSNTQSLYAAQNHHDQPPIQMVLKQCVSLSELRSLLFPFHSSQD